MLSEEMKNILMERGYSEEKIQSLNDLGVSDKTIHAAIELFSGKTRELKNIIVEAIEAICESKGK